MRYHNRHFSNNHHALIFDGVVMKERTAIGSRERMGLVAMGIKPGGEKEIIDYCLGGKGEPEQLGEIPGHSFSITKTQSRYSL